MKKSLAGKIQSYLLIVAILGSITLLWSNLYTLQSSYKMTTMTYQSALELFMKDVDRELNSIATYMNTYSGTATVEKFCYLKGDDYFSKINVEENLYDVMQLEKYVSGLFVYSKINDYMISIRKDGKTTFQEKEQVIDYIKKEENQEQLANYIWQEVKIQEQNYLIYVVCDQGRCYGAWCRTQDIMESARLNIQDEYANVYLTDTESVTNDMIGNEFKNWTGKSLVIKMQKALWKNFDGLIVILLAFSVGCICMLFLLIHNMQKYLVKPVQSIVNSIRKIGEGNLNEENETEGYVAELKEIGDNLNSMTKSIQSLKIEVYEEQLEKKDAVIQLQNAQIKPHFMLNVINNIYSMASVGDLELIKKCCRYLADYMRYVFSQKELICSVEEEFIHIQEYIRLQELRFCDDVICNLSLEPQIVQARIPTMAIMTFVENTFKHGMGEEVGLIITIEGFYVPAEGKVHICIMDNGPGFPETIINSLNNGEKIESDQKKIGIQNSVERFKELYGDDFAITISNIPQTTVELKFPLNLEENEDEQHEHTNS